MSEQGPNFFRETTRDRGLEDYRAALGIDLVQLIKERGEGREAPLSLLDIGCGQGRMLAELSKLQPHIRAVGLDPHEYSDQYHDQIEHAKLDDFNPAEKFDLIVSVKTFHYIDDKIKALAKINSLLKQGGLAVINLPSDLIRLDEQVGQPWPSDKKEDQRFGVILGELKKSFPGIDYEYINTDASGFGYSIRSDSGRFVIRGQQEVQDTAEELTIEMLDTSEIEKYLVSYYKSRQRKT